jgi:hypothetical protein
MSSLNEISTDQMRNRVTMRGGRGVTTAGFWADSQRRRVSFHLGNLLYVKIHGDGGPNQAHDCRAVNFLL